MSKSSDKQAVIELQMVGLCFAVWGDDGCIQYQGVIRGAAGPDAYICQFFDWIIGEPSTLTLIQKEKFLIRPYREPHSFVIFEDDKHLRFWIEHKAPLARKIEGSEL